MSRFRISLSAMLLTSRLTNYTEKDRVNVIIANPPFGGIVANNNETNFPQNLLIKEVPICF